MKSIWIFTVAALLFFTACSPKEGERLSKKFERRGGSDEVASIFEKSEVTCEDAQTCPPYVGGMISIEESSYRISGGACSVTLIESNKILTNKHCLLDRHQYKGALCNQTNQIYFPKSGSFKAQRVKCKKVIAVSQAPIVDEGGYTNDWAIVELGENISRPLPQKSVELKDDGESLVVFPVHFDFSHFSESRPYITGRVRKNSCQNSIYSGPYNVSTDSYAKDSPGLALKNCRIEVIKGNSGSGIFNSRQELWGVLSHSMSIQDDYAGAGTKWRCVNRADHPGCMSLTGESEEEVDKVTVLHMYTSFSERLRDEDLDSYYKKLPKGFRYKRNLLESYDELHLDSGLYPKTLSQLFSKSIYPMSYEWSEEQYAREFFRVSFPYVPDCFVKEEIEERESSGVYDFFSLSRDFSYPVLLPNYFGWLLGSDLKFKIEDKVQMTYQVEEGEDGQETLSLYIEENYLFAQILACKDNRKN